jgi:hypothetical protein
MKSDTIKNDESSGYLFEKINSEMLMIIKIYL